jgi:glycogen operon protein
MKPEDWTDTTQCFGMLMDGRAPPTGIVRRGEDATLLMVLNAHHDLVDFALPETAGGTHWQLLIDTNLDDESELGAFVSGEVYGVTGRSLLLFALVEATPALEELTSERAEEIVA